MSTDPLIIGQKCESTDDDESKCEFQMLEKTNQLQQLFTELIGDKIPWREPNVSKDHEESDLAEIIQNSESVSFSCLPGVMGFAIGITGIGLFYIWNNIKLIDSGKYGFMINSGKPYIMFPGWQTLLSPMSKFVGEFDAN